MHLKRSSLFAGFPLFSFGNNKSPECGGVGHTIQGMILFMCLEEGIKENICTI
jgi:hypothetical protein